MIGRIAAAILIAASLAWTTTAKADCTGQFQSGQVCGNPLTSIAPPDATFNPVLGNASVQGTITLYPGAGNPTSPINGTLWTTAAGLFAEINGSVVGPFSTINPLGPVTFSAGIRVNGPGAAGQNFVTLDLNSGNNCTTGCGASIFAGNNLTGTSASQIFWNNWAIVNDSVAITTNGASLTVLYASDNLNSASVQGNRNALWGDIEQTVVSANGPLSNRGNYVGVYGISATTSGDGGTGSTYLGNYFGANFFCGNKGTGKNLAICTAAEFDNFGLAGATQKYKFGINIADGNGGTAAAGGWDAAIAVYALNASAPYSPGRGWQCVLCVGDIASSGLQPVSSTATILGVHLETLSFVSASYGIDWSNAHFSTALLKGQNVLIDSLGSMVLGANTASPSSSGYTTLQLLGGVNGSIVSLWGNGFEYGRLQASAAGPVFYMLLGNSASWQIGTTGGTIWGVWTGTGLNIAMIGSAATPSLSVGNTTTGFYSVSTTGVGITVNGTGAADYGVTTSSTWTFNGGGGLTVLNSGAQVGNPTGGNKGFGTINVASGLYVNGVAVSASSAIIAGTTTISGTCTSGFLLFNNAGVLGCQSAAGGGNVSNSGTPTNGQMAQWVNATQIQGINTTGSGSAVLATSPTLVTPVLGVAAATSINKVALTAPATGSTLTIVDGKTLTASNTLTLAGTDGTTWTGAGVSMTVAALNIQDQTLSGGANVTANNLGTINSGGSITVDCGKSPLQYFTNNSSGSNMTITAPSADGSCILYMVNSASAGTITFSGFTESSNIGDALTTTNTNKFFISLARINGVSNYVSRALQ